MDPKRPTESEIDESIVESFPASDPPAHSVSGDVPPRQHARHDVSEQDDASSRPERADEKEPSGPDAAQGEHRT